MMLYARSCERPSNSSASVFLPSWVSNTYSLSTGTQGSSRRLRLISWLRSACWASSCASSSRAVCHSSRVPVLCSGMDLPPSKQFHKKADLAGRRNSSAAGRGSASSRIRLEPGRHDLLARGQAGRVSGHGGQVRVALHDAHAHGCVRGCANGGRSRLAAQQGDLAEAVAAFERPDDASVENHLGPTGLDDVEALAGLALLEDHLARQVLGMLEAGAELLDRRRRECAQHGNCTQALDVRITNSHP